MSDAIAKPPFTLLEKLLLIHLLGLLLGASWLFGGNIWWMRIALSWWASGAVILTVLALVQSGDAGRAARRDAWRLLPWLLFCILVITSALNPSFRAMTVDGEPVLVHTGPARSSWPSTVNPGKTLNELWHHAGIYLAAFNLLLIPRGRRLVRLLLAIGGINCLALAIFGTMQKLLGAGFYFGAATSPNARYFATFIYNNHWGAFMILWLAATGGLLFHHSTRHRARDLWHSPFTAAMVGLLIIAVSGPMSASRAATGMVAGLVTFLLLHGIARVVAARRQAHRPVILPVAALLLLFLSATGGIGWLAAHAMNARYIETKAAFLDDQSLLEGRLELYRDTWRLAMQKPAFGWGLESYGSAFQLIRPRPIAANRQYETSYTEAHSDWLQSVAETGLVGTGLVVLMALVPFGAAWRPRPGHPIVFYAWLGCAIIAAYAWFEFPFANSAVLITFWLLFFSALQYRRLQRRQESTASPRCIPS